MKTLRFLIRWVLPLAGLMLLAQHACAQMMIGQFPAAAVPLNCELVPLEQGGVTSNAPVCDFGIAVQGTVAPTANLVTGRQWLDTATSPPTLTIYDGAQWVGIAQFDTANHKWTPLFNNGSPTIAGSGAAAPVPEFKLFSITSVQSTGTGLTEQILGSYSMPANTLDVVGRNLRITAWFSHAANTHTVTDKLYFGSESISDGGVSSSGIVTQLGAEVLKIGTGQQSVIVQGAAGSTLLTPAYTAATENEAAPITIKATSTDGTSSAGDGNLVAMLVEIIN